MGRESCITTSLNIGHFKGLLAFRFCLWPLMDASGPKIRKTQGAWWWPVFFSLGIGDVVCTTTFGLLSIRGRGLSQRVAPFPFRLSRPRKIQVVTFLFLLLCLQPLEAPAPARAVCLPPGIAPRAQRRGEGKATYQIDECRAS